MHGVMKYLFALLALLGAVVPYALFVPWLLEHGFEPRAFLAQALANRISMFAWMDVIVSAVALIALASCYRSLIGRVPLVAVIVSTLTIGVSCGLPLLAFFLVNTDPSRTGMARDVESPA
jgi:hypothetical protein